MGICGNNKQIIENIIMTLRIFNVRKPSQLDKYTEPGPKNVFTMKVRLQYLFLLLCKDNTQFHSTRMEYKVSLASH